MLATKVVNTLDHARLGDDAHVVHRGVVGKREDVDALGPGVGRIAEALTHHGARQQARHGDLDVGFEDWPRHELGAGICAQQQRSALRGARPTRQLLPQLLRHGGGDRDGRRGSGGRAAAGQRGRGGRLARFEASDRDGGREQDDRVSALHRSGLRVGGADDPEFNPIDLDGGPTSRGEMLENAGETMEMAARRAEPLGQGLSSLGRAAGAGE
jgi:hypothetical protein